MNERSISIKRMDVGPAKRVNVTVTPTSFSIPGLDALIAELTAARDDLMGATEAHYTAMLSEAVQKNR